MPKVAAVNYYQKLVRERGRGTLSLHKNEFLPDRLLHFIFAYIAPSTKNLKFINRLLVFLLFDIRTGTMINELSKSVLKLIYYKGPSNLRK